MMEFIKPYQTAILFGCGLVCVLLALFVLVMKFESERKKYALIRVELSVAVLLVADALAYIFRGNISALGFSMTRVSNFLVFAMTLGSVYFLNEYIVALFMSTGKFEKLPNRLRFGFILPLVGLAFVIISQFTGIYYSFDANNLYQRGPLFVISYLIPIIAFILEFTFIIQNKSVISKRIFSSLLVYIILPNLAALAQVFLYGLSLINIATWISALTLFFFALKDQNDALTEAKYTDVATGLLNADGFQYEMDQIIHHGNIVEYDTFYFDIVRLNRINRQYGKKAGDDAIYEYAKYLKNHIEKDELVGRLGGNFFVALIKRENAKAFLDMLQKVPVEIVVKRQKIALELAAITGGYEIHSRNMPAGQLLGKAAAAVGYAKNEAHKPVIYLDEKLEKQFEHMHFIEEKAKIGLLNNEFEAYFQPKVDTVTNTMYGAEALVRWFFDGKMVPPFEFISIMEKNGSICELDFYVLRHVCALIEEWITKGFDVVPISVNFSRKNLGNPILAEAISKVVEEYDIPKELIQIEITETLDEFPLSYLIGVVEALQRYGMTVAIDDFGTGSSSINLLKVVEFDVLKIDKSFMDYENEKQEQLLYDMIHMAKNIGIEVVAEGVEEMERVESLRKMGCTRIQGYVFDKPLPRNEFEKRLANKQYE